MPRFELEINGRKFEIEAPSANDVPAMGRMIMDQMKAQPQQPDASPMVPSVDPMGMGTGFEERPPERSNMPYGQQMGNVGQVVGKMGQGADDLVRQAADGATFGATDHLAGLLSGRGVESERALTQKANDRTGYAGDIASILGGAAGGVGLVNSGLTSLRFAPKAPGAINEIARLLAQTADSSILGSINSHLHGKSAAEGAKEGALWGMGGAVVGNALATGAGKIGGILNRPGPVPSRDALKEASQAAYGRADEAGVILGPGAMQGVSDNVKTSLSDFGYHPQLQPRIATLLSELDRVSQGPITAKGIDVTRRIAQSAAKSQDPSERALGGMIIGKLDDALANVKPADVIAGDPKAAAAAYGEGRDLWRRQSKMATIEDALTKAGRNASASGSGGNIDNATRQAFKSILNSPAKSLGYTRDEISAMEDIVKGTPSQNAMRLIGKLSPGGNGLMQALSLGATAANPLMAIPATAGIMAKGMADKATKSSVDTLARIIASGGSRADALPPPNALQRLSETKRDTLIKALIGAGIAYQD